ncbi:MAG: tRNA pseudouridine38-40 synthase [Solirubrobacterales bacterium]|jgi:tRNA pseudouridine38-40 synthase|nr:tRNA pseudouridine38-40 synthase [Solirubrobacterales bacterium]
MTTLRIDLAYNGAEFAGWASQPGKRTVQAELETALATVLREPAKLTVAGRTDAGVHALGQVASLESGASPAGDLRESLNGLTGHDLVVHAAAPTADGFDARRDALSRTYCYRVHASPVPSPFERGLALWWPYRLDPEALHACAAALVGRHDFTAFTRTDSAHVHFERDVLRAEWRATAPAEGSPGMAPIGAVFEFWIESRAFMRSMVRVLVGTMLEVAGGRRELADFERLLRGAPREEAGDTARPHGLYLAEIRY